MLKIKNIKPVANHVVTTMDFYTEEEAMAGGLYLSAKLNTIKEYQKVIAVGPYVKDINVGDIVRINPSRYIQILHKEGSLKDIGKKTVSDEIHSAVDIPNEELWMGEKDNNGNEIPTKVMILFDSDIMCVVEGEEVTVEKTKIQKPSSLIVPPGGIIKN